MFITTTMDSFALLALNVPGTTSRDLSALLGLGTDSVLGPFQATSFLPYDKHNKFRYYLTSETLFKITVNSREEAVSILKKHNFTLFQGYRIKFQLWPNTLYKDIPHIVIESKHEITSEKIYEHCQQYGTVISVMPSVEYSKAFRYIVSYTTREGCRKAQSEMKSVFINTQTIDGYPFRAFMTEKCPPDFLTSKAPEKTKGNLIDVPTNIPHVQKVLPGTKDRNPDPKKQVGDGTNYNQDDQNSLVASKNQKKRLTGTAEAQRSIIFRDSISIQSLTLQPGEISGATCNPKSYSSSMKTWCEMAFISYETLHNLSSFSKNGSVSTSTLTWGLQLDISTFRMHYGSSFTPFGLGKRYPTLSSLTVAMRQYGDKDSAAALLNIRNNGVLPETSKDSLTDGVNITTGAPILQMKCLESGLIVASSGSVNKNYSLRAWDLRDLGEEDLREKARNAKYSLQRDHPKSRFWFDVQGMNVCSVDSRGIINVYDMYNTTPVSGHTSTATVDYTTKIEIDENYDFYSSCISINGFDSNILVGSDEHAQIARWDPRSSKEVFTSMACRRTDSPSLKRTNYDPVYDIEWNPKNSNEFMTTHASSIRVWDVRKMSHDGSAVAHHINVHNYPVRNNYIRKARWSPHHSDCIATLTIDGMVKIWKIDKTESSANATQKPQDPELLFVHQGHELIVSDFSWCPYVEDVIATVSPGTANAVGNIQVWRPRNIHDSEEHGEP